MIRIYKRNNGPRGRWGSMGVSGDWPSVGKLSNGGYSVSYILDKDPLDPKPRHDCRIKLELSREAAESLHARLGTMLGKPTADEVRLEAYTDAARVVMEPRAGVSRECSIFIAQRLLNRAEGCNAPGAGRLPNEPESE